MITGINTAELRILLLVVLFAICQPARPDVSLTVLLEQFAHITAADAAFREEKHMALLDTPLVLEGTLSYRAPDYLRKEVRTPERSAFEIVGDSLHIETGAERRTLSLDSHPLIRAFAESYRATLSGNAATLERYFETALSGTQEDWTLCLLPRDDHVRKYLESIVMRGHRGHIYRIRTLEASGDTSLMTITPAHD